MVYDANKSSSAYRPIYVGKYADIHIPCLIRGEVHIEDRWNVVLRGGLAAYLLALHLGVSQRQTARALMRDSSSWVKMVMYSISEIQKIVAPIARHHGVERMTLFGSYAREENTPDSDIDLRIDRGSVRGLQMAFLLTDLEDALKTRVDLLTTSALDEAFLSSIRGEEKLMYERK